MSRRRYRENKERAETLLHKFDADGYPDKYPWAMEFLCKVSINDGKVNTANQQDTLNKLWEMFAPTWGQ